MAKVHVAIDPVLAPKVKALAKEGKRSFAAQVNFILLNVLTEKRWMVTRKL